MDYHSEWITVNKHRVKLCARYSFPTDDFRFIARIAAEIIDNLEETSYGRTDYDAKGRAVMKRGVKAPEYDLSILRVYYNDKASTYTLLIVGTESSDRAVRAAAARIKSALEAIYCNGNYYARAVVVADPPSGWDRQDNFDLKEYLYEQAMKANEVD